MLSNKRFRVNDKQVVHEVIDGEVLAINLDTGTYYSMRGVSAQIWLALVGGASPEAISQSLVGAYEGDLAVIENAVAQFLDKMNAEHLIVAEETPGNPAPFLGAASGQKAPFVEPVVEIYTDMQELLLLDPIHDVDEAGWPVRKPERTPEAQN